MHRISARPAPLDFHLSSAHAAYSIDRVKDIAVPHFYLPPVHLKAPIKDGLHTPPEDDMTTYQHPSQYSSNYASRQDPAPTYPLPTSTSGSYAGAYSGSGIQGRHLPHSNLSQSSTSTLRNDALNFPPIYRQSTSPLPQTRSNTLSAGEPRSKSTNGDAIIPSLQIPPEINNSGGSLAEFAAQITCLFWFESTDTLIKAENMTSSTVVKPLREETLPSTGFKKWVVSILTTTQVTPNVIILALLFIYRLKKVNPIVKGRSGSEYRMLTVALMLGNKFLDDNTYTNKTWAEVSGISVAEVHVMEVEFLSNMRYSLLASSEQWREWQQKLGKFWDYCDAASRAPLPQLSQISPQALPVHTPALPSPSGSMQASPPSLNSPYSSSSVKGWYTQQWPMNYGATLSSPTPNMPEHDLRSSGRKRSHEGDFEEPAPKRTTRPATTGPASYSSSNTLAMRPELPRLPAPHLTISTSQPMSSNYSSATSMSQNVPLLPPINGRSMSNGYPNTPSWAPNLPVLTPTGPSSQHGPLGTNGYTTPSRRHSPHSVHDLLSLGSSPTTGYHGHNSGHISPLFLQQRNSPYKPIRHVNTLLYPPPASMQNGYSANADHMHYQPLGRRNVTRIGVLPQYPSHGQYQQWPVLPQPNFLA